MTTDHCSKCEKARRAFERRFGKSVMPLLVKHRNEREVHVLDQETGSNADYDVSGWRIRRTKEFDANQ